MLKGLDFKLKREGWCESHEKPLLNLYGRTACPDCQRELIEQQEAEYIKKASMRHEKRITYERLYKDSIYSDYSLTDASFQSFIIEEEESERNKLLARRIAGRYLKGEVFNTVLTGNAGAGKSFLAMAILKAVNENADPWKSCLFVNLDEFLLEVRSTFGNNDKTNKEDEKSMLERIADVDLLVLDDLGAETGFIGTDKRATDFTQRMLYALMNRRQNASTIITTNLNGEQLDYMYDSKILSRLYRRIDGNIIKFEKSVDKRMKF